MCLIPVYTTKDKKPVYIAYYSTEYIQNRFLSTRNLKIVPLNIRNWAILLSISCLISRILRSSINISFCLLMMCTLLNCCETESSVWFKIFILICRCWLSTESGSLYFFIVPAYLIVLVRSCIKIRWISRCISLHRIPCLKGKKLI